jgi:uncharacterized membrane protein
VSVTQAAVLLGGREWMPMAILVLTLAVLLLGIAYWRTTADARTRWLAAMLKAIGLGLLVLCLVEPLWSTTRAKPGANLFLIVADNSRSMEIDAGNNRSRGEWLRELLIADEAPWQVRLAQDFDVRRFLFDARLQNVSGFEDLNFVGNATSIDVVLETLAERLAAQPLAGILLLTDGNSTTPPLPAEKLKTLPPIYPILPPTDRTPGDLSIAGTTVSETIFEDAPVTVTAQVAAVQMDSTAVTCQLLDEQGDLVEEQTQTIDSDKPLSFRFQVRPKKPGLSFYTVRVAPEGEVERTFAEDPRTREATLANNQRQVAVNREGQPYRVLYVGGRPNWEYKFLRRGIEEDPQISLVGFLRIARREAKFDFRGRADESSNPLFRGFKKEGDEETESYDQPVIIRLNARNEAELRDGFPKEKAELFEYDALVLDDIEAEFFTHDQLALIERFVSERGGGLMMLGGPDTFRHGGYSRTPVGDALPVYLDRPVAGDPQDRFRLRLTRDGWLEPWIRLRDNEADEKSRLAQMPQFWSVSRVDSVKPAARVMASVTADGRTEFPAVVTQSYGRGRVLAVMIGDLWRWGMHRGPDAEDDLGKAWRQMVRWTLADIPRRLQGAVVPQQEGQHQTMRIALRVRDKVYQPQDNANLSVQVRPPGEPSIELDAQPSLEEAGLFEVLYTPRSPGAYRAEITHTDDSGEVQRATLGWTSDPAADEFREITINRDAMARLAEATGGEVVEASNLNDFVTTLPARNAPLTETWLTPLWHRSWVFALVLLCLIGEWGIRRLRGLP